MKRLLTIAALAVFIGVIAVGFFAWLQLQNGFSARDQPSFIEAVIARRIRSWSLPRSAREMKNPVASSGEVLAEARAHFADHCAVCHANNGSGDTVFGRGLYPKPPDMRQAGTQSLTDGQIFHVIHNGIRLTGMPAFGEETDTGKDVDSWKLVHFIRHLPQLTKEELEEMKSLNPISPAELRGQQEMRDFLHGKDPEEPTASKPHKH